MATAGKVSTDFSSYANTSEQWTSVNAWMALSCFLHTKTLLGLPRHFLCSAKCLWSRGNVYNTRGRISRVGLNLLCIGTLVIIYQLERVPLLHSVSQSLTGKKEVTGEFCVSWVEASYCCKMSAHGWERSKFLEDSFFFFYGSVISSLSRNRVEELMVNLLWSCFLSSTVKQTSFNVFSILRPFSQGRLHPRHWVC